LDVEVEQVSDSSVRVSWIPLNNLPEVTGYRVYYSQIGSRKNITDPSQHSVVIGDLNTAVQYQFQVVPVAMLHGMEFVSNRSIVDERVMLALTTAAPTTLPPGSCGEGMHS
jgi:hypothetical protein